jgi:hypothetical protein
MNLGVAVGNWGVLAVASSVCCGSGAQAQQAMQWRVEVGGNGHWYAVSMGQSPVCWESAKGIALASGGHLATLTSESENSFVRDHVVRPADPGTAEVGPYIGASCDGYSWQDWRWVTGEPFEFSAFSNGEPNSGGSERYVHFWHYPTSLHWNDCVGCNLSRSFVVEWSADCNGDGIVDYGQCRDGTLSDADGNNIPDCCEGAQACCAGNLNGDQAVDGADLGILLNAWGTCAAPCAADLNRDGFVDGADLGALLGNWGACP